MAYDRHLTPLFTSCSDEELDDIVNVLLKKSLNKLKKDNDFQLIGRFYPSKYTGRLIKEIQRVGGNSIANVMRGGGVEYSQIVQDVARKVGIKKELIPQGTEAAERMVLSHLLEKAYEKMSDEQKESFTEEFKKEDFSKYTDVPSGALSVAFLHTAINSSGFLAYKLTLIIANAVARQVLGHGLRLGTNAFLMRGLSFFAGPIGLAITAVWGGIDLSGPAYRVTIPIVVFIAGLRMKKNLEAQEPGITNPKQSDSKEDPYNILGVNRSASNDQIKRFYHTKMKKYHPDNHSVADKIERKKHTDKTAEINSAYETIKMERGIK
ncbi:DnaJ domain-containing protein [Leptospira sp. 201903075]|uniref:DnaJ domain-containing protein n=1 Tax=Leptospira chreensis TaxID=2810035 RepID=UPI0019653444|nr:DnaJ domain-containing protein [Leptospira chreensis]MBM9592365.1 DnaJ domain-containing protein [Leptospira chreensis]